MVTAENSTGSPFTGCVQVLAARSWRASFNAPRGGGELNSEPTTEKRKRAHNIGVEQSGSGIINISSPTGERNDVETHVD
jgi:hypothetical protein